MRTWLVGIGRVAGARVEALVALARERDALQARRAEAIAAAATGYLWEYAEHTVDLARRDIAAAGPVEVSLEGKRQADELRATFDQFLADQRSLVATQDAKATRAVDRALVVAAATAAGTLLVVTVFAFYVTRMIVRPIRRAAVMADPAPGCWQPPTRPGDASSGTSTTVRSSGWSPSPSCCRRRRPTSPTAATC